MVNMSDMDTDSLKRIVRAGSVTAQACALMELNHRSNGKVLEELRKLTKNGKQNERDKVSVQH